MEGQKTDLFVHEIEFGPQKFGLILILFSWSLLFFGFGLMTFFFQDYIFLEPYLVLVGLVIQLVCLFFASEKTPHRLLSMTHQWKFAVVYACSSLLISMYFIVQHPSLTVDSTSAWWVPLMFGIGSVFVSYTTLNTASSSPRSAYGISIQYNAPLDFDVDHRWTVHSSVMRNGLLASCRPSWEVTCAFLGVSSSVKGVGEMRFVYIGCLDENAVVELFGWDSIRFPVSHSSNSSPLEES